MLLFGAIIASILLLYYLYWKQDKAQKEAKVGTDEML